MIKKHSLCVPNPTSLPWYMPRWK